MEAIQLTDLTSSAQVVLAPLAPAWAWASDFLIIIVPTLVMILIWQYKGRGPFVSIICGLYIGYALYAAFPFLNYLPTTTPLIAFGAKFGLFVAFFLVGYIILRRVAASDFIHIGMMGALLISLATAGFIVALLYHVFPIRPLYTFSPMIDLLFAMKELFIIWFIAPLAALFVLSR